ncbi:MAG: hypothetical protein IJS56_00325 [Bacilli bacterium]|nr:hypothetical protein [Bacilli bacterium]
MSRLYGTKINNDRWDIIEIDNKNYHSYKLIDKKYNNTYFLNHIIGIEQVTNDEFLVFKRVNFDDFEIIRYKMVNSQPINIFSKSFNCFSFITDDRILFSYWGNSGPYRSSGIYSIKDNTMLNNANWLDGTFIKIYNSNENLNDTKLYVEKEINSFKIGNQKLLFVVDPNTLEPISDCYSQLRDSFIKVDSKEDIEKTITEDKRYINIIEKQIDAIEKEHIQKSKEKLLYKKNKK